MVLKAMSFAMAPEVMRSRHLLYKGVSCRGNRTKSMPAAHSEACNTNTTFQGRALQGAVLGKPNMFQGQLAINNVQSACKPCSPGANSWLLSASLHLVLIPYPPDLPQTPSLPWTRVSSP